MEPLLQQIVEFMQDRPAATRWILVPTLAAGHTLGERLARAGFAWANLRFTTPLALAARIAGPVLGSRGITEMDQGLGPALLLELLLDLPAEVPQYFRKIVDQPGVAEALWECGGRFSTRRAGLCRFASGSIYFAGETRRARRRLSKPTNANWRAPAWPMAQESFASQARPR